jgi:hypothetical protein
MVVLVRFLMLWIIRVGNQYLMDLDVNDYKGYIGYV